MTGMNDMHKGTGSRDTAFGNEKEGSIEELEKTEKLLVTKKTEREATKDSVQKVLLACAADRPKQVVKN